MASAKKPKSRSPRKTIPIETIAKQLAAARKVGFDADRAKRIGASEIGQCARKVVYGKLGLAADDGYVDLNGFATRGNVMEDAWIAPLVEAWVIANGGVLEYHGQKDQISFQGKNTPLSATPDGLAIGTARDILAPYGVPDIGKGGLFVPEFKSLDPRYGRHKLPKSAHVPQVLTQLGMIRHATKHRPEWGAVLYCDASDWFDLKWFPVKWDERAFKGLVNRASKLLAVIHPDQVPPEGKINGGSECSECPFQRQCLGFLSWVPDEDPRAPTSAQVRQVEAAAAKVHDAEQKADRAKQLVRSAEANLYGVLNGVGRRFVMGKRFTVSAKETASQNRLDAKAMEARLLQLGEDISKYRRPTKPGASLSVEAR